MQHPPLARCDGEVHARARCTDEARAAHPVDDVNAPLFDGELSDEAPLAVTTDAESALGRYRLRYQIASGGMATVYLGYATGAAGFARAVAIKRIHPHLASRRAFVEMFFDEARIASRIHHPNVCSVVDFGEVAGSYFIAMELLDGESLASVLRRMSRDTSLDTSTKSAWWAVAPYLIACACEGLHAAHELKDEHGRPLDVVHRDVSPHNVFVTYDGGVKVVDFGVAHARDRIHETATGTIKGKLAYMAPEHASGRDVDRRADVWSLGVCLWEMLAGARLFRRKNEMETMLAIRSEVIRAPSHVRRSAPSELDAIVLRALDRDPTKRHPTARALGRELQSFVRTRAGFTGPADVEEWMQSLFGDEPTGRRALLAEVERTAAAAQTASLPEDASDVHAVVQPHAPRVADAHAGRAGAGTRSLPAPGTESLPASGTESLPVPGTVSLVAPETADAAEPTVLTSEPAATARVARPDRAMRWLVAATLGAFVLVVGGIVVGVWATRRGGTGDTSTVASTHGPRSGARATDRATLGETSPAAEASRSTAVGFAPTAPAVSADPVAPMLPTDPASRDVPIAATRDRRADAPSRAATSTRAEATSSAEAGFGTVNVVVVDGWAQIIHGGRDLGRTPRQVRLRAGRQTLELRPFGRTPAIRRTVRVEREGVVRLAVRLSDAR